MGFHPAWVVGAIVMVMCGGVWGVPMMLAGAVHATYSKYCSQMVRRQMAMRVREMLLSHRPALDVPLPTRLRTTCSNNLCKATLPKEAVYCPRCGTRAAIGPAGQIA